MWVPLVLVLGDGSFVIGPHPQLPHSLVTKVKVPGKPSAGLPKKMCRKKQIHKPVSKKTMWLKKASFRLPTVVEASIP